MLQGGRHVYYYAVLNIGILDFYKDKMAYDNGDNKQGSLDLRYMNVSLNPKDFVKESSSFSATSFFGKTTAPDVTLTIALIPLEDHEVVTSSEGIELQATDAGSFRYTISYMHACAYIRVNTCSIHDMHVHTVSAYIL